MIMLALIATGRGKLLPELFKVWVESGESWMRSTIMQNISNESKTKKVGAESYVTFRDLVTRHGKENAEKLRSEKKEAQSKTGDAYPEVPHWMVHPDFKDNEVTCLPIHLPISHMCIHEILLFIHEHACTCTYSMHACQLPVSKDYELFLCFDTAKISQTNVGRSSTSINVAGEVGSDHTKALLKLGQH